MARRERTSASRLGNWATIVAVIGLWEVIAGYVYPVYNSASRNIFPPPSAVVEIAGSLLARGELLEHIAASVRRVLTGFALAAVTAVPLGLSMGAWAAWRQQVSTLVEVLRPVPPFAWIPLGLLWFGVGDAQSVFVIFIASFFPILLNTVSGVDAIDPIVKRAALCLGASRWRLFSSVVLRGALPSIFVGLRIGLGFGWMVLVGSELTGAIAGLGYLILDSRNMGLPNQAFMGMVIIGLIGYALDGVTRCIEKVLLPWRS